VTAQVTRVFEADNKLTTGTILRRLTRPGHPAQRVGPHVLRPVVWGLGMVPPPYLGTTFDGSHKHYLTTGSTVLDALDVDNMIKHVTEHGYGLLSGSQLVLIVNPIDFEASSIAAWKAGVDYGGATTPKYDFIPERAYARMDLKLKRVPAPNPQRRGQRATSVGSYNNALNHQVQLHAAVLRRLGSPRADPTATATR